jgi:hypothetical protein
MCSPAVKLLTVSTVDLPARDSAVIGSRVGTHSDGLGADAAVRWQVGGRMAVCGSGPRGTAPLNAGRCRPTRVRVRPARHTRQSRIIAVSEAVVVAVSLHSQLYISSVCLLVSHT